MKSLTLFAIIVFLKFVSFRTVYSGAYFDPDIIRLLKASEQQSYYVVSPVHYLPSASFIRSVPLFFPAATTFGFGIVDNNGKNNEENRAADSVDITDRSNGAVSPDSRTSIDEDTVRIESEDNEEPKSRSLNPPDIDFEESPENDEKSNSDSFSFGDKLKDKESTKSDQKLGDTYLPPKKESGSVSSEYLPPTTPKPVYGPPSTVAPTPVYFPSYIIKSYIEPGFTFGSLPLVRVPLQFVGAPVSDLPESDSSNPTPTSSNNENDSVSDIDSDSISIEEKPSSSSTTSTTEKPEKKKGTRDNESKKEGY